MTYRDLPPQELTQKLMATSFGSPSMNKKVFDWCNAVYTLIQFRENERVKLVEKYGEKTDDGMVVKSNRLTEFFKEYNEVLDMAIESEIPSMPLNEDSFNDDSCCYPKDKELWISPKEIAILMGIKEKQGA